MTFPPPHPAAQNSIASAPTKSSGLRQLRSQQSAWGLPAPGAAARRGLTPLSTDIGSSSAESSSRPSTNAASPSNLTSTFSSVLNPPSRSNNGHSTFCVSSSSSYPALQSGSQQPQANPSILSPRSRTITPSSASHLPSSAASPSTASQAGVGSSSGGGGSRSQTFSPSLLQHPLSSPINNAFDRSIIGGSGSTSSAVAGSSSVSKIVVTQVFILLGSITEKEGRAKWESQAETIRKLVESNGMEVFSKYFRRLLSGNLPQIFPGINRNVENPGNYQLLVQEMEKITKDPAQATKIAETIDTSEGDIFRDFDLVTFMNHFRLDPLAKTLLGSAFLHVSKADLNTKAGLILSENFQPLLHIFASPSTGGNNVPETLLALCAFKYLRDLPEPFKTDTDWSNINQALRARYSNQDLQVPPLTIRAALAMADLMEVGCELAKDIHNCGPRATSSVEAAKEMLLKYADDRIDERQIAEALLYLVLAPDWQQHSPANFLSAVRDHVERPLHWPTVIRTFDQRDLVITAPQFLALYNTLLPVAQSVPDFDLQALWNGQWQNPMTQLYFVLAFISLSPTDLDASSIPNLRQSYDPTQHLDGPEEVIPYISEAQQDTSISYDAIVSIFDLAINREAQLLPEDVIAVTDVLFGPKMGFILCSALGIPPPRNTSQDKIMEMIFHRTLTTPFQSSSYALYSIWRQDSHWVVTKLMQYHQREPLQLPLILEHAQQHGWLEGLLSVQTGFTIDLAALADRRNIHKFGQWAQEKLSNHQQNLVNQLLKYLEIKCEDELRIARGDQEAPRMVPLAIKTVVTIIDILNDRVPDRLDSFVPAQRQCISAYPRITIYEEGMEELDDDGEIKSNMLAESADTKMQELYKQMYSGAKEVEDIIPILQSYKTSDDPDEKDLFACMVHGLFEEYSCFRDYPLPPLATTSVLFGGLISYGLISGVTLDVGLGMILEAVRDYSEEETMYKFGLQALTNMLPSLEAWPSYCAELATIPGLQGTAVHHKVLDVLSNDKTHSSLGAEPNGVNGLPDGIGLSNGDIDDFLTPTIQFKSVHSESSEFADFYEEPDEEIQEKIIFFFNNVSEQNLELKTKDLQKTIQQEHRQWFAFTLVEQRAKLEPNLQQLYLEMLKQLGDQLLWAEVLRETYVSVEKMLNAESTLHSANERKNLKSLAAWLGSLTIARDKPILHKFLALKDLLIEGYEVDRLIVVIPFVCNVLIQATKSVVFKPPNPWTVDIIRVLLELYQLPELKLNQKFEIEVLCKELDIDKNRLDASTEIRNKPPQDEDLSGSMLPETLDSFDDISLGGLNRGVRSARFSPSAIASSLPDLTTLLRFPPSSGSPTTQAQLHEIVRAAVQRSIVEIIAPVVERSVTIATLAATNLIHKDFAREENGDRLRQAAQQLARQLSGSLALVTCKEPLRMSMTNYIRLAQNELPEHTFAEGAILMCVNDNLDLACSIVEKQAEERSMPEIEAHVESEYAARRQHQIDHPNEPYINTSFNRWSTFIPDPFKLTAGGLNQEQMAIYLDFARQSRGPASHTQTSSLDGGRQLPDVLQEAFASVPNISTPAEPPAIPHHQSQQHQLSGRMLPPPLPAAGSQPQTNGYYDPRSMQERIRDLLDQICRMAQERPERALKDLDQKGPIVNAINQMWDLIISIPAQLDHLAWTSATLACMNLYRDSNSLLDIDILVQLLEKLCQLSPSIYKEMVVLFSSQEEEKALNASVTVALLEAGLLDIRQVDSAIARLVQDRREEAIEALSEIMDALLLNNQPVALRADFSNSLGELGQWNATSPGSSVLSDLVQKLKHWGVPDVTALEPDERSRVKQHQFQYIFSEWLTLCGHPSPTEKMFGAFISQLHQKQLVNSQEEMTIFLRICMDTAVDAYEQDIASGAADGYFAVDGLAKLVVLMVRNQGEADGAVKGSKVGYMNSLLSLITLILNNHHIVRGEQFNQKVFFRLYSSILCEWDEYTPQSSQEDQDVILVFAENFLMLQPRYFPAFTYSWLMLISHRTFMPTLLKLLNGEGWESYANILDALFLYITDTLRPTTVVPLAKDLYRGALRIMLILHHDFPEFLAENHYRLCNSIPAHCTQLRNLVLSAFPSSFADVPDPFTQGLKVDRLEEIRRPPRIGGNTVLPLEEAHIRDIVDNVIRSDNASEENIQIVAAACGPFPNSPAGVNTELLHALVLYLGESAIDVSNQKNGPGFNSESSQANFMTKLAKEFHPEARYHFLSSIANQLRFPNSHTHYFSHALLHLFGKDLADQEESDVRQQITRVLLERLIVHRPHPWGLIITLLELLKNPVYTFWELPFIKAAPEIERLFAALFDTIHSNPRS